MSVEANRGNSFEEDTGEVLYIWKRHRFSARCTLPRAPLFA